MNSFFRNGAGAPESAQAWMARAGVHARRGEFDAVIACCDEALALQPSNVNAFFNKGVALQNLSRLADAEQCYREILRVDPRQSHARINLGLVLLGQDRAEEAASLFRALSAEALELALSVMVRSNLALSFLALDRNHEAEIACREALALDPHNAAAIDNLGCALKMQSRVDEAVIQHSLAIARHPGFMSAHSNLLLALNFLPDRDPASVFAEHRRWGQCHANHLLDHRPHKNERDGDRRLRVGYVSPDFREHSVAMFLEPLLAAHDRSRIEVYGYSNFGYSDATTDRLRKFIDHWRPIADCGDQQVADLIRKDEIDILVDLAGHTAGHRLLVFARKPAPVQVTWLGYPNTTGMAAMDYRITDAWADPPGESDSWYSETLVRLPEGFLCFQPPSDSPPVSDMPARETGHITFGCFNNSAKIGAPELDAWSNLLKAVPASRLLLKSRQLGDPPLQQRFKREFKVRGVDPDRIEMVGRIESRRGHLELYGRVDIGLDPFPYNGTTTTCEALWMGVPVVVLAGDRHAGRVGTSLLSQIELRELIAKDPEEYISIAIALGQDPARCSSLRASLRDRLNRSKLYDATGFARRMETAYRHMWHEWLAR
jgi:predicted O-linked N-acetylglucosamine transferase (SPINDLY family)